MISVESLMQQTGVTFGTSGVRGEVVAMNDRICYAYTVAFLNFARDKGDLAEGDEVAIAGDFRPSTPQITAAVAKAVIDASCIPVNCGNIPTPAVTYFGMQKGICSIMVTGSHIPDDRNGIKFNLPCGEILKQDEAAIRSQHIFLDESLFNEAGCFIHADTIPGPLAAPAADYLYRYLNFFDRHALSGLNIGLYEHSGVARQLLGDVLEQLGATVMRLGYSETFVPVDTEAIRPEDTALARDWSAQHGFDAIVSTDGDGDRPLISDEHGHWLHGDIAGVLTARYLGCRFIVTPVSSNSVVEKCGWFEHVERTRIGSPYVVSAMNRLLDQGLQAVMGYEANGGFLVADSIERDDRTLDALPTRDAVIVILAVLLLAKEKGVSISRLVEQLPPRFTASNRIKQFPTEKSREIIGAVCSEHADIERENSFALFGDMFGEVKATSHLDGLRIIFSSEEIVHLRPSGNAPELRCYTEADSQQRANDMNDRCLALMQSWKAS